MINSVMAPALTTSVNETNASLQIQVLTSPKVISVVDKVSVSTEAQQALRQEQFKPKNAVDLFNDWLESGSTMVTISIPQGDESDEPELLPENQALLAKLKEKMRNTPDHEERMGVFNKINLLRGAGKNAIFNSESDLDKRMIAMTDSIYLQQKYLVEKYGDPMGVPSEEMKAAIEQLKNDPRFNQYPRLSELTGKEGSSDAPPEIEALFEPKGYDLTKFNDSDFLMDLLAERDKTHDIVSKRIDAMMNDFNHPYWEESLKQFES